MMSLRHIVLVLAVAGAVFVPCSAQVETAAAQSRDNPLKNLSLEQLGNVEVTTTSKEPVQARRTAAATFVLTQEDIRRSGATSIPEVLRLVPGVEVARMSSTNYAIGIRGLQSNFSKSVLVLIDGRSVYTPLFAGVYWDVQDVVLEDIERIEVIRGPGATVWGPNAVNGVINIITKPAAETQGALVSVGGGNVDHTVGSVRYGGSAGSNFHYRLFGRGFDRGAQFNRNGHNFDRWHQERGGFRTDWTRNSDSVMFEGEAYGGDSPHLLGATTSNDKVSGGNVVARWRRTLSERSDLYLETYVDRTNRIGSQFGETRTTWDVDFLHHFRAGQRHEFSYGGGLRFSPNNVESRQTGVAVLPASQTDTNHSLFAQDDIHLAADHVLLTIGSKLEYNNYTGWDAQPTGRILWAPNNRQSLWAAFTRAVTTPSRIEEGFLLSGTAGATTLTVHGNPNFRSESMLGFEAGYRHLITPKLNLDISIFHNDYQDLQSFAALPPTVDPGPPLHVTFDIPYANAIAGRTDGAEIAPNWQVTPAWRLSGSYSYVGLDLHANAPSLDISSTGSVRTYEGSTPHHMVMAQSMMNLPHGFEFDAYYQYASKLPAQKLPGYQTADLRLGWRAGKSVELSVTGQNLFQPHHYEWGTGDPAQQPEGIRRAVFVRLVWRR